MDRRKLFKYALLAPLAKLLPTTEKRSEEEVLHYTLTGVETWRPVNGKRDCTGDSFTVTINFDYEDT